MHTDHGLGEGHWAFAKKIQREQSGHFVQTSILPRNLPYLISALYGPLAGDPPVVESEVFYAVRGNRRGPSRMVCRNGRHTKLLTVIGDSRRIYTAFGGLGAPKEPWDTSMRNPKEIAKSWAFWNQHALSASSFELGPKL